MAIIDSLKLETLSTDGSGFASIDGDFASNLVAQNQSFGSIDIGSLNSALSQLGGQDAALAGSVRSQVEAGLTPVEQGQLASEADIVVTAQARPVSDAEIVAYEQAAQPRPTETVVFNNVRELDVAEGRFRVEQALTGPKANDPEIEAAYAAARPALEAKDAAAAAVADRATLDVVKAVIPPLETATAAYRVGVNGEYTLEHGITLGTAGLSGIFGASIKIVGKGTAPIAVSAADAARLNINLTSKEIAAGHAFEKHVLGVENASGAEFGGLGIRTHDQFAAHIENVVTNPTQSGTLLKGRSFFHDDATNTIVIVNPKAPDGGTAFRPVDAESYIKNLR